MRLLVNLTISIVLPILKTTVADQEFPIRGGLRTEVGASVTLHFSNSLYTQL